MTKAQVLEYFGTKELAAHALGVTGQAIAKWPDVLTKGLEAKVILGVINYDSLAAARRAFPESFKSA